MLWRISNQPAGTVAIRLGAYLSYKRTAWFKGWAGAQADG